MSVKIKIHHVRESKKHEGYGGSTSVMGIWGKRPRDVYPKVSYSSVNDMYNTLLKYGYGDKHPIYYKNNSPEQIKGHILGYFKWTPTNSDADIEADALAAATMIKNNFNKSESKKRTNEMIGNKKWVIRIKRLGKNYYVCSSSFRVNKAFRYPSLGGPFVCSDWDITEKDIAKYDNYNDAKKAWDGMAQVIRGGLPFYKEGEDYEIVQVNFSMMGESKEPADEKLGYEKGHKNSRGEDAPWVIRSHEDNRILASFAHKKDAEEHMKRMKQYSKGESYELASKEIQVRKPNGTWQRWSVTWPEYVDTHIQDAKDHGWTEVRVVDIKRNENTEEHKKSEDLESYACYIDFGSEDAAKDGMKLVKRWNPLRDGTAVMVDGIGENAANSLWKDWLDQCIKAGLDIMDNGEVYKEEPSCIYGESKKSEALFNKTEMENVAIKAAVKAAWSAAKVKYFRIDFRNTHPGELNVYPVTSDGKDVGPFWGVSADKGIVYQYSPAWDGSGKDEVVREMKFKDVDGIEEIFTDEFIAMDDTLEVSIENGGADITLINSSGAKDGSKKSEDSDNSGESKAWCVTVEYKSGDGETEKINVVTQRHDTEEQARQAGIAYVKDKYAPANDINVISAQRLPKWASRNIQNLVKNKNKSEDANDVTYELTEEAVTDLIKELGLEIVNTWYDGNKDRIVYDCKDKGDENGETVCVWVEPPYEARVWLKDVNPRVNQLVEGIETIDALKAALVDIFKIELGESHITESLRKPEDTIIVPNWLWETYTLGENYDGDTLTDDEQQTYLDFKEKYEGFNLKAVSEKTTFRSDNDFDSNGCPCYEVNVFKK